MSTSPSQLHALALNWCAAWSSLDLSDWVSLYSPSATYTDHAFQIHRSDSSALYRHLEIWRTAIPDFTMELEDFHLHEEKEFEGDESGTKSFSMRTINKWTFWNDLPTKKASEKSFVFRGVVDLRVDKEGLIKRGEEWYTWDFGEGRDVGEFHSLPYEDIAVSNKGDI